MKLLAACLTLILGLAGTGCRARTNGIVVRPASASQQAEAARAFKQGEGHLAAGEYNQAIIAYNKIIVAGDNPFSSRAYYRLSICFDRLNDPIDARLLREQLIKRYPNSAEAELARTGGVPDKKIAEANDSDRGQQGPATEADGDQSEVMNKGTGLWRSAVVQAAAKAGTNPDQQYYDFGPVTQMADRCEAGEKVMCFQLAHAFRERFGAGGGEEMRAQMFRELCDNGDRMGCDMALEPLESMAPDQVTKRFPPEQAAEYFRFAERGCVLCGEFLLEQERQHTRFSCGVHRACAVAAQAHLEKRDMRTALERLATGCRDEQSFSFRILEWLCTSTKNPAACAQFSGVSAQYAALQQRLAAIQARIDARRAQEAQMAAQAYEESQWRADQERADAEARAYEEEREQAREDAEHEQRMNALWGQATQAAGQIGAQLGAMAAGRPDVAVQIGQGRSNAYGSPPPVQRPVGGGTGGTYTSPSAQIDRNDSGYAAAPRSHSGYESAEPSARQVQCRMRTNCVTGGSKVMEKRLGVCEGKVIAQLANQCGEAVQCTYCLQDYAGHIDYRSCQLHTLTPGRTYTGEDSGMWWCDKAPQFTRLVWKCASSEDAHSCIAITQSR